MVKLRTIALGLTLGFAFLVAFSCEFLTANIMPAGLTRMEARIHLDRELERNGIGGSYEIRTVEVLDSPLAGRPILCLLLEEPQAAPVLAMLDGKTLSVLGIIRDQNGAGVSPDLGPYLAVDEAGYFVSVGQTTDGYRLDPRTLRQDTALPVPSQPVVPATFNDSGSHYQLTFGAPWFTYQKYQGWVFTGSNTKEIDMSLPGDLSLRAVREVGDQVRVFFYSWPTSTVYVLTFPSAAAMETIFGSVGVYLTESPDVGLYSFTIRAEGESAWFTGTDILTLSHDDETRWERYDAVSGRARDSYALEDTDDVLLHFYPDGSRWLKYSRRSGTMDLYRSWW